MNTPEAKKYAQNLIVKGTALIFFILIFIILLGETRGDFANGILFFLDRILNLYFLSGIVFLFVLSGALARKAGVNIIIEGQAVLSIAAKYSILISLAFSVYVSVAAVISRDAYSANEISSLLSTLFVALFLRTFLFIFVIWLWAGNKLKKMSRTHGA